MSPMFYGKMEIMQLAFLLGKWAGRLLLLFHLYIRRVGGYFFSPSKYCSILKKVTRRAQLSNSVSYLRLIRS